MKIAIVGAGPAGATAALLLGRSRRHEVVLLDRDETSYFRLATDSPDAWSVEVAAPALDLDPGERTLVLGTEELMQLPLRLAQTLADAGGDVVFSTTTRSPAVVVDEPDYALRSGVIFAAHDDPADGPGRRFAYNLAATVGARAHDQRVPPWDRILVVVDPPADTPGLRSGLLRVLAPYTSRTTLVVTP